ncbi:MAG: biliverdin-producing heme oxygenase [Gemmatimonadetes bacterium]|nr:biliverdin-producing heme oxygenase [Gemmatimonadota bacterium]
MENAATGIMGHLRDTTRALHTEAESRPLQRAMAKGTLPPGAYVMYLGQLRHLHESLETSLDAVLQSHPGLAGLFTDDRRRVPDLDRDLAAFDVFPETIPVLPPTVEFISRVEDLADSDPVALLGPLYVLEGSTNGGKFLARVLERSLQIEDRAGLSYMDPYGDRQPEMWAEFKRLANQVELTPDQLDAVTEAACDTFRAIAAISDTVLPPDTD